LTYGKEVNVRTYTYAQLDCKYDALCLKDKKIQCLEELKHAAWLWAMRIA
jgi:hypothetical protein